MVKTGGKAEIFNLLSDLANALKIMLHWFVYKTSYVHFSKLYRRQKTFWIVCFLLYSYKIQPDSIF